MSSKVACRNERERMVCESTGLSREKDKVNIVLPRIRHAFSLTCKIYGKYNTSQTIALYLLCLKFKCTVTCLKQKFRAYQVLTSCSFMH